MAGYRSARWLPGSAAWPVTDPPDCDRVALHGRLPIRPMVTDWRRVVGSGDVAGVVRSNQNFLLVLFFYKRKEWLFAV